MNTYNVSDINFINSDLYQQYIKENPKEGYLKIRAYAAGGAIPISGLRVTVTKIIDNNNVVFFDGVTDSSGVIERIVLPAPTLNNSDLVAPSGAEYDINTYYEIDDITNTYKVNMFEGVFVVQNISLVPKMNRMGDF